MKLVLNKFDKMKVSVTFHILNRVFVYSNLSFCGRCIFAGALRVKIMCMCLKEHVCL